MHLRHQNRNQRALKPLQPHFQCEMQQEALETMAAVANIFTFLNGHKTSTKQDIEIIFSY